MDKLEHPEINPIGLTAEVRRAISRQAAKSQALGTDPPAIKETSALESTAAPLKDNSTQARPLSNGRNFGSLNSPLGPLPKSPKVQPPPAFEPNENDEYHVNDLLKFHDTDFLDVAYRVILKREPDSLGYTYYLEQLREGHLDKVDLLASLRFSSEGELRNVKIDGLALPTLVRRLAHLPIIGYPIRWSMAIFRLPALIHRVRRNEAYAAAQRSILAENVNNMAQHVDTLNDALAGYLSNLSAATTELLSRSEVHDDQNIQIQQRLETLVEQAQLETVADQLQNIALDLRQQLRTQIDMEQVQRRQSIQEQQSLLEVATNDTRNRIAEVEVSTRAWTTQHESSTRAWSTEFETSTRAWSTALESSTRARSAQHEASVLAWSAQHESATRDRTAQLESSARAWIGQLETSTRAWIGQLESSVRPEIADIAASTNDLRTQITAAQSVSGDLQARINNVESSSNDLRSTTSKLESSTNTAQAEIERVFQQLQHARTELALQGRRMTLILDEARRRLPAPFDQEQLEIIATEGRHKLDALYAELEDTFRGSYDEIKNRFRTYLPLIKSTDSEDNLPIVDLGCGRGEWLELLKEEGYRAVGLDTNRVLLDRCRARGLDVVETDVLQYLRGLQDNQLRAITGFHIIEHLEIGTLMQLLDEVIRVVHPGGVIIFETPNPENVLVGSNYFYFDPTHRNPLPSLLMKFLLESRGLHRVEVLNLHAWDQARLGGKSALTARFNDLFYGPMDYAIAGWKVSA